MPHCYFCRTRERPLLSIGFAEQGTGPGRVFHGCPRCIGAYRVIPLSGHPPGSDGSIRYHPPCQAGGAATAPPPGPSPGPPHR